MNPESLNAALVAVLNKAISAAEKGGEFLAEQIPDVVNQLLMWHLVKNLILVSLILLFMCISGRFVFKFFHKNLEYIRLSNEWYTVYGKEEKENERKQKELLPYMVSFWLSLIPFAGSIICFLVSGVDKILVAMQILIAPKVYLIEYAASLVK